MQAEPLLAPVYLDILATDTPAQVTLHQRTLHHLLPATLISGKNIFTVNAKNL